MTLSDYTNLDFAHDSVQTPPPIFIPHIDSFLKVYQVSDDTFPPQSSQLAPYDFPLVCLLQFALFIPEPKYSRKLQSAKDCILKD